MSKHDNDYDYDDDGAGLSPETAAQAAAVMVIANGAVQRATEQLFHGLNSLAPIKMPDILMKIAIGQAFECWMVGVEASIEMVRDASQYVTESMMEDEEK